MILEMKNIKKHFGDHEVLKDISFNVDKGEVVSVIDVLLFHYDHQTKERI